MTRLFVDNLTVIDFSFLDHERGVVGESWIVDIELIGELDEQGMVFDFGDVKKQIKRYIDAEIDHRLLVPTESLGCKIQFLGDVVSIDFQLSNGGQITHQSPSQAIVLVDAATVEMTHITQRLQQQIKKILPQNVGEVVINLRQEQIDGASYQYTHGLQKHLGNCQRIAHGHRSRIEISIDGERDLLLEAQWAKRLEDGYIVTEQHIVGEYEHNSILHSRLAYTAEQGDFEMSLPSERLFHMPMETTVENIAGYLATVIAKEHKGSVLVKAFEGVAKGAYGECCSA